MNRSNFCLPGPHTLRTCVVLGFLLPGLIALSTACRTPHPLPPADLSQPGWQLQHGQAAWRLPSGQADLAGELTAAFHTNGSLILEFTKTPLALVVTRIGPTGWELNLIAENRSYRGHGVPPARSAWLALARALSNLPLPANWSWQTSASGQWQLHNIQTGERLQGYLTP